MKRAIIPLSGFFLLLVLLACSTTGGPRAGDTTDWDRQEAARRSRESVEEDAEEPFVDVLLTEEEETGLRIRSTPSGADVFLNNRYMGITPLTLDDIDAGSYKVTLKLDGYYSESEWISYDGEYESLYFDLDEITGFLRVETFPPDAQINYENLWVPADRLHEMAVGPRTIRIRAFGYQEQSVSVQIDERSVTELSVILQKAPFDISGLQSNRRVFNPRNAGLLGSARITFRVSTHGRGRAVILDPKDQTVFSLALDRFDTWQQGFEWNGRGADGAPLPDGRYTVRVEGEGEHPGEQDAAQLALLIDSSVVLRFRSLLSGSAGLVYAPGTDVLPGGSVQFSSMVLAQMLAYENGSRTRDIFRTPVGLGMRFGLSRANLFELDTSVGGIIGYEEETFFLPWFVSAAFKASLLRATGAFALSSAAQVKFTYQNTYTDTLANFRGLSVGAPGGVHLGPLTLLFSPEVILSWAAAGTDPPPPAAYAWLYGRFGLLLDLSTLSLGASISMRTLRFDQFGGGFGIDLPFQAALEAHWLIPGTQLFVSASVAGDFSSPDDYCLFGGVGLGILD